MIILLSTRQKGLVLKLSADNIILLPARQTDDYVLSSTTERLGLRLSDDYIY